MRCGIRTSTLCCSSRLYTDWDLLSLVSGTTFCCFVPFQGPTLPSSSVLTGLFFFKSGLGFRPRSMGICGGGGATWDLGWPSMWTLYPQWPWALLNFYCLYLMPCYLPLRSSHLGVWLLNMECETEISVWFTLGVRNANQRSSWTFLFLKMKLVYLLL